MLKLKQFLLSDTNETEGRDVPSLGFPVQVKMQKGVSQFVLCQM